ncbi:MFS transporter [Emticicia sp. BO119]|uniref:MFS transporter n=1 Tax=Emticicia sp. BO119 TaxID=2757768 RepID=UPI0015F0C148|nr:MFS transporter [Emticicia sp. BO119]MBA4850574.1 MFS transporter [Emticicia sp. BO119]
MNDKTTLTYQANATLNQSERPNKIIILLIIVSALGYFVDVYDMMLFTVVRKKSLLELGIAENETLSVGLRLLNFQTIGLLAGGIFWGILGDKKGRLNVLFGSIIIYSLANILNGFVSELWQYGVLRVIAGFGLAGELGAGVTIVMESLKKETRTIGATLVASFGLIGAIVAGYVGEHFDWRVAFIVGGVLGLFLLLLRIGVHESDMYKNIKNKDIEKGKFLKIFASWDKFSRYAKTILVGLPSYFVLGLLLTIAPEFAKEIGIADKINTGHAMMYCFAGFSVADLLCGLLSQKLKSRKAVFYLFNMLTIISIITFFYAPANSLFGFYIRYTFVGFGIGYWAMLVTNASEQFGTNYRATVTTTVPNFIRGALVPIAFAFESLKPPLGLINSGVIIGLITVIIALGATFYTRETFHKELDYNE